MIEIIPAVLTDDPSVLKKLIGLVEGKFERIQIDIIDGEYVDNKTIEPHALTYIETNLDLDFHLMVREPVAWVDRCVEAGADRIIGQIEAMESQENFVSGVRSKGVGVGLGVDLSTSILDLEPEVLGLLDVVLLMDVQAGFGGQEFNKSVIDKVIELAELKTKEGYGFRICADGGVNKSNLKELEKIGVCEVAVGAKRVEELI